MADQLQDQSEIRADQVDDDDRHPIILKIEKYFKLRERGSKWTTEIRAGCVTFVTMAYILVVNANILSDTGGPCVDDLKTVTVYPDDYDMNMTSTTSTTIYPTEVVFDGDFFACLETVKLDLITGTAVSAALSTLIMGVFANLPIALAPGMGINAYFVYTVVGPWFSTTDTGVNYQTALCAVFIEGWIFLFLAVTGLRIYVAKIIPQHLKSAITVGIGLFLAMIGLQPAEGIGLVVSDGATNVTLGGCGHGSDLSCLIPEAGLYCGCAEDTGMTGATTWIGIIGFVIMCLMMIYKVKGAVMIGILFVAVLSWFRDTEITYFPDTTAGNERYTEFKKVVDAHAIEKTGGILFDGVDFSSGDVWIALITFLYVDLLDTTGTLYSMAEFAGMLDAQGNFEGQTWAFCTDAIGTIIGSTMGISPVTSFIESGSGINEGARTGIASVVTGLLFLVSLFFSPILAAIPPWATGPALVVVGALMASSVVKIDWENPRQAFPAFISIILMPFTYSIAYGIIGGLGVHFCIVGCDFCFKYLQKLILYLQIRYGYCGCINVTDDGDDDGDDEKKETDNKGSPVPEEIPMKEQDKNVQITTDDATNAGDADTERAEVGGLDDEQDRP